MNTKENPIVKDIIETLNWQGFFCFRVNSGMIIIKGVGKQRVFQGAPTGTSDIIGCTPDGKFLAIEVKTPERRNEVTEPQQNFIDNMIKRGGVAFSATSVDETKEKLLKFNYHVK